MTQEDKELLLKDLCARLPYGVKVYYDNGQVTGNSVIEDLYRVTNKFGAEVAVIEDEYGLCGMSLDNIKPYLFPMSSITEEQRNDISKLLIDTQNEYPPYGKLNTNACDNLFICVAKQANIFINYCLTHHLDFNGLIEKGIAIDATGLNIY